MCSLHWFINLVFIELILRTLKVWKWTNSSKAKKSDIKSNIHLWSNKFHYLLFYGVCAVVCVLFGLLINNNTIKIFVGYCIVAYIFGCNNLQDSMSLLETETIYSIIMDTSAFISENMTAHSSCYTDIWGVIFCYMPFKYISYLPLFTLKNSIKYYVHI